MKDLYIVKRDFLGTICESLLMIPIPLIAFEFFILRRYETIAALIVLRTFL